MRTTLDLKEQAIVQTAIQHLQNPERNLKILGYQILANANLLGVILSKYQTYLLHLRCDLVELFSKKTIILNNIQSLGFNFSLLKDFVELDTLVINDCEFIKIPSAIFELSNLRHLTITNSPIREISSEISKLVNLETLDLSNNKISKMPNNINKLSKLIMLDLSDNKLGSFVLSGRSKLVHLYIDNNELCFIGNLKNLADLELLSANSNKLQDLEILDLQNLFDLHLENNLFEIAPNFLEHPNLKNLALCKNPLKEFPSVQNDLHSFSFDFGIKTYQINNN